jgi:membrane-associated protease RseP (regulator of RpoE activity)
VTPAPPRPRYHLHLALFFMTLLTTTVQGSILAGGPLVAGLSFSLPLMTILVFHEFGHYFAAKLHGVPASLPYFIPLPPIISLFGTMGAVITQGGGTTDRRKLIDIGAAGPLAGLLVAIPVLIWGIKHSEVRPLVGEGLQEGNSLLYAGLKYLLKHEWLPDGGRDVMLHPAAWAGWAGMLITMINLLPISQLDGGHIATAYFGNRYARAARIIHMALPWLALVAFGFVYHRAQIEVAGKMVPTDLARDIAIESALIWIVFYALLAGLGRLAGGIDHPPVDDQQPLPRSRAALFWLVAIVFILIFIPVPLRQTIGAEPPPASTGGSAGAAR